MSVSCLNGKFYSSLTGQGFSTIEAAQAVDQQAIREARVHADEFNRLPEDVREALQTIGQQQTETFLPDALSQLFEFRPMIKQTATNLRAIQTALAIHGTQKPYNVTSLINIADELAEVGGLELKVKKGGR
jgi:hypothetical protein